MVRAKIALLTVLLLCVVNANAQTEEFSSDLYPDEQNSTSAITNEGDDQKSAAELYAEGSLLLMDERLLDARSKLLKALAKDPKFYKVHILLAGYYTSHVGHHRLALRYIKQASELFKEQHGLPPYSAADIRLEHAQILYMLAQIRLSLDEYEEALKILDSFESAGYFGGWYPGTRAWVLMKLDRIQEAIEIARVGVLAGAEPGRTLNMLGILYSVNGQREKSIKVFDDAIDYEFSLGSAGQPATPLNNQAEVYREEFDEDRAETGWSRALSLPDGCEHVLPALNLSTMLNEQLRFAESWRTMLNFNQCVAQYALRNGEEHKALVNLAMGRIEMHTGRIDKAILMLRDALQERQWFGKIGTNVDDMQAAASLSLAQALRRKANALSSQVPMNFKESLSIYWQIVRLRVERWWLLRKTRMLVSSEMKSFEDLSIRNTDSILEYPWLGEFLGSFPKHTAIQRIEAEEALDKRSYAKRYYEIFKARVYFEHGDYASALNILQNTLPPLRQIKDAALALNVKLMHLGMLRPTSANFVKLALDVYNTERSALLMNGISLPVRIKAPDKLLSALSDHAFQVADSPLIIEGNQLANGGFELTLDLAGISGERISASGETLEAAVNIFTGKVFKSLVRTSKDSN
jgi:tetratricopeptide (TPR) repeat protein